MITRPSRGVYKITPRRQEAPESRKLIDTSCLNQFVKFRAFHERLPSNAEAAKPSQAALEKVLAEVISEKLFELEQALAQDLLERIMTSPPKQFKRLVIDLLLAMGYEGSRKGAG